MLCFKRSVAFPSVCDPRRWVCRNLKELCILSGA